MPEYPKCKDKKGGKGRNSMNYTVDDLCLGGRKDLDKREVGQMLIVREDIEKKELLLDCSVTAHMFDEQYYFASYIPAQTTGQYITVGSVMLPVNSL